MLERHQTTKVSSRSLKVLFDMSHMISYQSSIVTTLLPCIISEILSLLAQI